MTQGGGAPVPLEPQAKIVFVFLVRLLRSAQPIRPKPPTIIAQVAGSGTAPKPTLSSSKATLSYENLAPKICWSVDVIITVRLVALDHQLPLAVDDMSASLPN